MHSPLQLTRSLSSDSGTFVNSSRPHLQRSASLSSPSDDIETGQASGGGLIQMSNLQRQAIARRAASALSQPPEAGTTAEAEVQINLDAEPDGMQVNQEDIGNNDLDQNVANNDVGDNIPNARQAFMRGARTFGHIIAWSSVNISFAGYAMHNMINKGVTSYRIAYFTMHTVSAVAIGTVMYSINRAHANANVNVAPQIYNRNPVAAYAQINVESAQKIKSNLEAHLRGRERIHSSRVRQDIQVLSQGIGFDDSQKERLTIMLNTGLSEISLCWNYISSDQTEGVTADENKANFVKFLATSEGCAHGRKEQIFSFFQGLDNQIAPVEHVRVLDTAPEVGSDTHLQLCGQVTQAMTNEQSAGNLNIDASKRTTKRTLQPFFTQGRIQNDVAFQQMTPEVFDAVFDHVWNALESV
jgi:hypothetical protein